LSHDPHANRCGCGKMNRNIRISNAKVDNVHVNGGPWWCKLFPWIISNNPVPNITS
jgi:hypothetical protein